MFEGLDIVPFDFWGQPVYVDKNGELQCPGFVGKTYASSIWDYVRIGGMQTPGIAEVQTNKFRDVDRKKRSGGDGARITVHGIEPALVEIRIQLWTPEQWRSMGNLWAKLFPGPQKITTTKKNTVVIGQTGANASTVANTVTTTVKNTSVVTPIKFFDVRHPELELHRINSVTFTRGEGPVPGPNPRTRVFIMHAVEYMKPRKVDVTTSPEGAQALATTLDPQSLPTPGSDPANTGPE